MTCITDSDEWPTGDHPMTGYDGDLRVIKPTGNHHPADRMLAIVMDIEPTSRAVEDWRPNKDATVYGSAASAAHDLAMAAYADFRESPLVRLMAYADGRTAQRLAAALRDVADALEA